MSHSEEEEVTSRDQGFSENDPEGLICSPKSLQGTRVTGDRGVRDPLQNEHSRAGSAPCEPISAHLSVPQDI